MFTTGNLLFFTPFYFKNQNDPKNKFFIVLHNDENRLIIASLPTSQDHIPEHLKKHGCINCEQMQIICYFIKNNTVITDNGFRFDKDTYLYGKELGDYEIDIFLNKYTTNDMEVKGRLTDDELKNIRNCFANSPDVKRKYRRLLKNN
jgi:hypothetical protein